MYGEQLKDFGESFGKIFNDQIIGKLVSVKKSFGEDLSLFSDVFFIEFDTLFQDFDKMWREFKEMYQKNYFYLKSGTRTLFRVWENLGSNFQNKMDHSKILAGNVYEKMKSKLRKMIIKFDQKYAQYEVLLTVRIIFIFYISLYISVYIYIYIYIYI